MGKTGIAGDGNGAATDPTGGNNDPLVEAIQAQMQQKEQAEQQHTQEKEEDLSSGSASRQLSTEKSVEPSAISIVYFSEFMS